MTARSRPPTPTLGWWPACSGQRWPPHASTRLATQLQTALDSRVLIEQAKGVLMAFEKVDAQTAFTRLRWS
jgi:hypothetical protein